MPTPTHSGYQRMIENFRERVVSDDFNRAWQFLARQHAEVLRRMHAATAAEDEAAGKTAVADAVANPARAVVFEGLRARPEIGTTNLFVEPGAALVVSPHADPHPADSPARLILDPGVQVAGSLVLTAGGGGTRIDVVECQVADTVTEADNRDIFDPSTGLFSPALVNKVARGSLAYRIRLGVAGAGFPGTASGWLPLAVCSVPAAAVTWNDVTVWDVRPLLADLATPPHQVATGWNGLTRQHASAIDQGGGAWHARGLVEASLFGWKVGGNLAPTQSGAVSIRLDAAGVPNVQEPGFAAVASRPWYLYLAQPFGLPRWAKLSPSSSGERTPQSPRGIPVFTQTAPSGLAGRPAAPLALPTATGLGGTSSAAVVALTGAFIAGALFRGSDVAGGFTHVRTGFTVGAPSAGAGTNTVTYLITGTTHHPANAEELLLQFTTTIADAGGTIYPVSRQLTVLDSLGNSVFVMNESITRTVPAGGAFTDVWEPRVPLPPNLPTGNPQTISVIYVFSTNAVGAPVYSGQTCFVKGWRLFG